MTAGLVDIEELRHVDSALRDLVEIAASEGFAFGRRLLVDWESGANRFDGPNEVFLLAYQGGQLIGFGGLNEDPYHAAPDVGRVRHLYVAPSRRGLGVGGRLLEEILRRAEGAFSQVRLRTEDAGRFYEKRGFVRISENEATHTFRFG